MSGTNETLESLNKLSDAIKLVEENKEKYVSRIKKIARDCCDEYAKVYADSAAKEFAATLRRKKTSGYREQVNFVVEHPEKMECAKRVEKSCSAFAGSVYIMSETIFGNSREKITWTAKKKGDASDTVVTLFPSSEKPVERLAIDSATIRFAEGEFEKCKVAVEVEIGFGKLDRIRNLGD